MREDRLAALTVPNRTAGQIAADGHAEHHRTRPRTVRAPADRGRLALDLRHGRPDVVEELDLGTWPQTADALADRPADDVGLGERGVEAACDAEGPLQPVRCAEHAALALHVGE